MDNHSRTIHSALGNRLNRYALTGRLLERGPTVTNGQLCRPVILVSCAVDRGKLCINEFLDRLPQVYTPELYRAKCEAVYQHVYDSYSGAESNAVAAST